MLQQLSIHPDLGFQPLTKISQTAGDVTVTHIEELYGTVAHLISENQVRDSGPMNQQTFHAA